MKSININNLTVPTQPHKTVTIGPKLERGLPLLKSKLSRQLNQPNMDDTQTNLFKIRSIDEYNNHSTLSQKSKESKLRANNRNQFQIKERNKQRASLERNMYLDDIVNTYNQIVNQETVPLDSNKAKRLHSEEPRHDVYPDQGLMHRDKSKQKQIT